MTELVESPHTRPTPRLDRFARRMAFAFLAIGSLVAAAFLLTPYDPNAADFLDRLSPPSAAHWFGTDQIGRDIFTRILHGGLWSIGLALVIVSVGAIIGTAVGMLAGQGNRIADAVLMRLTDSFFAFPELVAAVCIAGILGPSTTNMVIALVLVSWMKFARLVRSLSVALAHKDFVLQARLNGVPGWLVLWRHYLPNIGLSVLVLWTNGWSRSILAISGLSFLGFGVQPPQAEWGAMLLDGKPYMQSAPHLMIFPGLAIFATVLAINLIGDRLRDLLAERH